MLLITHHILFYPDKSKRQDGCPIRCKVSWDASKRFVLFNVGYKVDIDKFNSSTKRCVPNSYHTSMKISGAAINKFLNKVVELIDAIFREYEKRGVNPTPDMMRLDIRSSFGKITKKSKGVDVVVTIDDFILEQSKMKEWTNATITKFNAMKRHILNFQPNVTFADINIAWLENYMAWLRDAEDMRNSTIEKHLGFLKWFLKWSEAKGFFQDAASLDAFKPKFKSTQKKVIYLTSDELSRLMALQLSNSREKWSQIRDMFCFCCFTGLRFSDAVNLRWVDVHPHHIDVTTIKTADSITIELNNNAQILLTRAMREEYPDDKVFVQVTNQVANMRLKKICQLAEIDSPIRLTYYKGSERIDEIKKKWELIGTHCGRRTFICNALSLGISPSIVMKWTGHSDYQAMKPYVDIVDKAKRDAMEKFNQ